MDRDGLAVSVYIYVILSGSPGKILRKSATDSLVNIIFWVVEDPRYQVFRRYWEPFLL